MKIKKNLNYLNLFLPEEKKLNPINNNMKIVMRKLIELQL